MKVLITGATGMVGGEVLDLCLRQEPVSEIISLVRRSSQRTDPKLKEFIMEDFGNYDSIKAHFNKVDIVFFCMGVYTGSVSNEVFHNVTVVYPVALAKSVLEQSPEVCFCYLSGAGADRSEQSRTLFAREKGIAENQLANVGLKAFYSFRPGYIYASKRRKAPNFAYVVSRWMYPLIKSFGPKYSITSAQLAQAMWIVGTQGSDLETLENQDILAQLTG